MSNPFLQKDLPECFLSKHFVFLVGPRTVFQCTENQTVLGAREATSPVTVHSVQDSKAEATEGQVFPVELDRRSDKSRK